MQALVRTFTGMVSLPARWWNDFMNGFLYRGMLFGIWQLFHFAFHLQKVELTSESDEIDVNHLGGVPRIYVSWHARVLGAVPILEAAGELHCFSMPHNGWGYEGRFQSNLRRAFFANMHRKGFRFIEMKRRQSREQTVRDIVERLEQGKQIMMTADSPKGGAFVAQLGGILAASQTGVEIVPYSFSSSRKIRINPFWDNFMVPVPFGTYVVRLGKPLRFDRELDPQGLEAARRTLARELNRLTHETDDRAGIRREYRLVAPETAPRAGDRS